MPPTPEAPLQGPQQILELARRDRSAATRALAELSNEQQLALLGASPVAERGKLLGLAPRPEALIPKLPEAELCFAIKALGPREGGWILEHATPEQIVACVDLDAWHAQRPDPQALDVWLAALSEAGEDALFRGVESIDIEMLVLYLASAIEVVLKPSDEGWEPPRGAQTVEGQFYYRALQEDEDISRVTLLLRMLFDRDYNLYHRALRSVMSELPTETQEMARRWRTGRLQDLGFPPREEAIEVYAPLPSSQKRELPQEPDALDIDRWRLPVFVPDLPADDASNHSLLRAAAQLSQHERTSLLLSLLALANKVAVADEMELSDAEATPQALEKTIRVSSQGLDEVCRAHGLKPADALRRLSLSHVFRLGAELDPSVVPTATED